MSLTKVNSELSVEFLGPSLIGISGLLPSGFQEERADTVN